MDQIISTDKLELITPLLLLITYLSSFKNNKPTCDRYLINYFLYLLTSISIYLLAGEKIVIGSDKALLMISFLGSIAIIFAFHYVENIWLKHLLWIALLSLLGVAFKKVHEKYGNDKIKAVISKLMMVLVVCIFIAIMFPQYIKPEWEYILFLGLIILLILKVIDIFVFKNKYDSLLSKVTVFIFSIFVIYDTDRALQFSKQCSKSKLGPQYLENILNMFLNIMNLFNNLLRLE